MNKTEKVIKEIIENEEELKEFLKQETMDELYSFILKKDRTITEEEFDETVANMLENYVSLTELKEVNEEDLESISGGMGKLGTKMASVALSALTLVPGFTSLAGATNGTNGAQENNNKSILRTAKEYISNKYVKAKNVIKKHPKIFAAGLAAAIVLSAGVATSVVAVRHHKNKQQNIKQGQNNQQSSSSATDKSEEKSEEKPEEKSEEKPEEESKKESEEKSEEESAELPAPPPEVPPGAPVARPLPNPPVSEAAGPGAPAGAPVARPLPNPPVSEAPAPGAPAPGAPVARPLPNPPVSEAPAPPAPPAPVAPPAPPAPGVPPAPVAPPAPPAPPAPGVPPAPVAPPAPGVPVSEVAAPVTVGVTTDALVGVKLRKTPPKEETPPKRDERIPTDKDLRDRKANLRRAVPPSERKSDKEMEKEREKREVEELGGVERLLAKKDEAEKELNKAKKEAEEAKGQEAAKKAEKAVEEAKKRLDEAEKEAIARVKRCMKNNVGEERLKFEFLGNLKDHLKEVMGEGISDDKEFNGIVEKVVDDLPCDELLQGINKEGSQRLSEKVANKIIEGAVGNKSVMRNKRYVEGFAKLFSGKDGISDKAYRELSSACRRNNVEIRADGGVKLIELGRVFINSIKNKINTMGTMGTTGPANVLYALMNRITPQGENPDENDENDRRDGNGVNIKEWDD